MFHSGTTPSVAADAENPQSGEADAKGREHSRFRRNIDVEVAGEGEILNNRVVTAGSVLVALEYIDPASLL